MNDIKDEILADAIATCIKCEAKIAKMKMIISVMGIVIIALAVGYFV